MPHPCRCCLLRPPNRDLKTPYTYLGKTEIYSIMIKECFDIHLTRANVNCGICDKCVDRLRDATEFKQQVQRSQVELQAELERNGCVDEVPVIKKEPLHNEVDSAHVETKSELPLVEAELRGTIDGNVLSSSSTAATRASVERLRDAAAPLACPTCHHTFHHEASLATHTRDVHGDSCGDRYEGVKGENSFDQEASVVTHTRDVHGDSCGARHEDTYTCDACGKLFTRKADLTRHKNQKHAANESGQGYLNESKTIEVDVTDGLTCEVCAKRFSRKSHLELHKRVHTGDKPYACVTCKKQFTQKCHLITHVATHTGLKPYTCEDCDKNFSHFSALKRHQRTHAEPKPFRCDECNKQFTRLTYLNQHKQIHTGEKRYACNVCKSGKQFTRQEKKHHMRIHVEQARKTFSCDVCFRTFMRNSHLTQHKLIHTGEKPFSCEECDKRFAHKQNLINHKRMHAGDKPFACDACLKRFTRKDYLIEHIAMHSRGKTYACNVCSKTFSERSSLRRHKRVHIGEKDKTSGVNTEETILGK